MKDEQIAERKRIEDMADFAIKNAQKHFKGLASDKDAAVLFAVRAAMWSLYCMTKSEARRAGFDAAKEQAGFRKMTKAELRALPPNGSFPALMYDPDLDHVGLPCDPWSLPDEDIEACLFMPVPAPEDKP